MSMSSGLFFVKDAHEVVKDEDVASLARQTKLSRQAAAHVLSRSRKKKQEILSAFRALEVGRGEQMTLQIRHRSGLDARTFRISFDMVLAAAKQAGMG